MSWALLLAVIACARAAAAAVAPGPYDVYDWTAEEELPEVFPVVLEKFLLTGAL